MRRNITLIMSIAVTLLWASWHGQGIASTSGETTNANVSPSASAPADIAPSAGKSDAQRNSLSEGATPKPTATPESKLPPCAHAGSSVNMPTEFPKNFPLPPGTVITATKLAGAGVALEALIPMELKEATRFFARKLPAAGFQVGRGEEERAEAEARFMGNGVVGFFKVRTIEDCPGALRFTITVRTIEPVRSPQPQSQ
jgi:hypothetical protein